MSEPARIEGAPRAPAQGHASGAKPPSDDPERLRARVERERRARIEAETIAERALADLYARRRELELLEAVAAASNAAEELRPALQIAIDGVKAHTGWPVGHAWLVIEDGRMLTPTGIWAIEDDPRFAEFRRVTELRDFECGEGLPGRVLESGEPAWIPDVNADDNFPRARVAGDIGVAGAFAFPVLIGDEVVAVIEFFSPQVAEPDPHMLDLVGYVGAQLGRVVERTRAAHAVAGYARELEHANDELKEFAYVASHDLSEPLRTISGFVQLLSDRYGDELDETAQEFIGFVADGTDRMLALIEGLLSYSRAGRADLQREPVATGKVVQRALESLSASIEDAGASIEAGELPTVEGDRDELERLFHNLISNAVKFHGDEPPVVRISAERDDAEWLFSVADNGTGIEERHTNRIFNVFQRLHGPGEYPGTGIGLSICKKVVERHGGRIWVEAAAGGGSAFRFALPAAGASD